MSGHTHKGAAHRAGTELRRTNGAEAACPSLCRMSQCPGRLTNQALHRVRVPKFLFHVACHWDASAQSCYRPCRLISKDQHITQFASGWHCKHRQACKRPCQSCLKHALSWWCKVVVNDHAVAERQAYFGICIWQEHTLLGLIDLSGTLSSSFGTTVKRNTIQRRLAWPPRRDDIIMTRKEPTIFSLSRWHLHVGGRNQPWGKRVLLHLVLPGDPSDETS
jgi:hypothetical protein